MRPGDWLPLLGDIADRADEIALAFFGTTRLRVDGSTRSAPVSAADSLPLFTITTTEPAGVAASTENVALT